jgi:hypothetical protein
MQHDFNIANQIGSEFRADLNNALTAIATTSSGSSEPSTTFAHQLWVDTGNNLLKIRNAANNAWITIGVSITASNTFTGDITGNVVGNITGNVVGDVTGDLTGNADTATTLATARTIQLSGDVVGSTSFDGSGNVTITTTISSDSTVLGTDTTGDYVESISGGTGVTITGGTGEGSTPSVAIGQAVATTDNVTFNNVTASGEFIGDVEGAVRFNAKADGALSKGDVVCITGVSGDVPTVAKADADDAAKMPAFGLAAADANDNAALQVVTFGNITELDTSGFSVGQILYVSTTAGTLTTTAPSGESSQIQNIGKVVRSHASAGIIKVGGAGRSNATPNLDDGKIFIGNASNQASTATLNTALVPESTNLYYTDARFDTRLATKDTDDLTEGTSSLYFTNERVDDRVNSLLTAGSNITLTYDDSANTLTIAATEDDLSNNSTSDLAEGTNLYYTDARSRAAISAGGDLSYNSTTGVMSFTERTDAEVRGLVSASGDLSYNSSTGVFSFTERTDAEVRGLVSASGDLSYNSSTGVFSFTERTDAEVRGLVSASGDLSYNSSTGVFSFTQRTDAQVQALITGGTGVTVSSGEVAIGQAVGTTDDVTFNDVTVSGDLVVSGTTTTINTETINLADNQIVLNSNFTGSSPTENGGIEIERGTQSNKTLIWNETDDKWTVGSETFVAATFEGALSGNATTATTLETARTINGVSFDGSANIAFDSDAVSEGSSNLYYTDARSRAAISVSGDLSYNSSTGVISFTESADLVSSVNTQTGAVVLDSDDISEGSTNLYHTTERVQDIVGGMVTGNTETGITVTYQDADGTLDFEVGTLNQDTTGNAATATALETARTINGTSFDGTANISFDSDSVSEGSSNLYFTNERVDDRVASLLTAGSNITLTYDDTAGTLTIASTDTEDDLSNNDTDDLSEGSTNLYYLDERVDDRVNNLLTAGTGISLSYDDAANTLTITGSAQYGDSDVESYLDGGTSTPTFASAIVSGDFTVDSATLVVDASENKVGINRSVPTAPLDVSGEAKISGDLTIDTNTLRVDSTNNRVGILKPVDQDPAVSLDIGSTTDAVWVPSGTTAQRPTGANGMFRYNSTDNQFEGYANGAWGAIAGSGDSGGSSSSFTRDEFTGNGSTTDFTLSKSIAANNEDRLIVFNEGVFQRQDSYTLSGTTLSFSVAPANGNKIVAYIMEVGVVGADPTIDTMTGDGSDTTLALSVTPSHENATFVTVDGVFQHRDTYSISGSTLTFSEAPPNGSAVECTTFTTTTLTNVAIVQDTDQDTKIQVEESSDEDTIRFDVGGSEKMVLDSSGRLLIGQDSGDAFNADAMLRLQRTGDRVFQQFKVDADQNAAILFGDVDDDVECAIEYEPANKALSFSTGNNSEAVRILSGGGITFNGDTSTSNALDDYEEGQWTPTIQGSSTNGTYTYGTNHGEYMKVGNIVVANFRIDQISVGSAGSGNIEIHGFPFTAKSTTLQYYWGSVVLEYFDTAPSTVSLSVGMRDGSDNALIWETRDTTTNGVVSITDINNTTSADVWGQVTYMT